MKLHVYFLITCLQFGGFMPTSRAQTVSLPQRPIVFIPGIIGSQLWDGEEQLWGTAKGLRNLNKLAIPDGPISSQPLNTCSRSALLNSQEIYRCGIVEEFVLLPPFKLNQYGKMLSLLEANLGYRRIGKDRNLFVFPYDWRRSNFDTAAALKKFVETDPALAGKEFDLLAHSMGGLVALIYTNLYDAPDIGKTCESQADRCRVQSVITMGTPFYGAMNAVSTADVGWGALYNWIPGGQEAITRTILSWPSIYELLPTYPKCCEIQVPPNGVSSHVDISTLDGWKKLPYATGPSAPSLARVEQALASTLRLKKLVAQGFPPHIAMRKGKCDQTGNRFFPIAGDHFQTRAFVKIRQKLEYQSLRGDETVILPSAAFGNVQWSFPSFTSHQKIFDDEYVHDVLKRVILRCDGNFFKYAAPILNVELQHQDGTRIVNAPVGTVKVDIEPQYPSVSTPTKVIVIVNVETIEDVLPPAGTVEVSVDGKKIFQGSLRSVSVPRDDALTARFVFETEVFTMLAPGVVTATVYLHGIPLFDTQTLAYELPQ